MQRVREAQVTGSNVATPEEGVVNFLEKGIALFCSSVTDTRLTMFERAGEGGAFGEVISEVSMLDDARR